MSEVRGDISGGSQWGSGADRRRAGGTDRSTQRRAGATTCARAVAARRAPAEEPAEETSWSPAAASPAPVSDAKPAGRPARGRTKSGAMPGWGWAVVGLLAAAAVGSSVGLGVVLARKDDDKQVEEKPANENTKLTSLETAIGQLEEELKTATARLDAGKKGGGNSKRLPPDKSFTDPLYGIVKVVKYLDEHREHPRTASGFFINDQNWVSDDAPRLRERQVAENHHLQQRQRRWRDTSTTSRG